MPRVLARFEWDIRRMGMVEGLFVTTTEELEKAYGREIYFGEILGKHSEVAGTLDREDIEVKSDDQEFIDKLVSLLGSERISGYCPLDYFQEEEEDEECEDCGNFKEDCTCDEKEEE